MHGLEVPTAAPVRASSATTEFSIADRSSHVRRRKTRRARDPRTPRTAARDRRRRSARTPDAAASALPRERPALFAAARVIGTHAAGRAVRADDQEILEPRRRGVVRGRHRHLPGGAERERLLPRRRIERDERAPGREEDARGASPRRRANTRARAATARPAASANRQISAPLSPRSATTRSAAVAYKHPVDDERRQLRAFERRAAAAARADTTTLAAARRRSSARSAAAARIACRRDRGCSSASRRRA